MDCDTSLNDDFKIDIDEKTVRESIMHDQSPIITLKTRIDLEFFEKDVKHAIAEYAKKFMFSDEKQLFCCLCQLSELRKVCAFQFNTN